MREGGVVRHSAGTEAYVYAVGSVAERFRRRVSAALRLGREATRRARLDIRWAAATGVDCARAMHEGAAGRSARDPRKRAIECTEESTWNMETWYGDAAWRCSAAEIAAVGMTRG